MLQTSFLLCLPSILILSQNFGLSRGILTEKWIRQYQDHFDSCNDETWLMRYYENDEFYHQSGPIFIKIGGESAITPDYVTDTTSLIYKIAKDHGAMMYITEHRYYGKSHPVPDTSFENLRYLSITQALADIALFIEMKKKELNSFNAFVMVFGGSYAGNLAAWMRVAYPTLVQGALASSAPIYVKADFFEYYEFVGNFIRKYDENCAMNIKEAFTALEKLFESPAINSIKVKNDFKLRNPDFSQPSEIPHMMLKLAQIFAHAVSSNRVETNGKTSIENLCTSMKENKTISSYHRLAEVLKKKYLKNNSCINLNYNQFIEKYRQTSWTSKIVERRLWIYHICTELGYYQTFSSSESIFGSLVSQEYFNNLCRDLLTPLFNSDYLKSNIMEINRLFNMKLPNTKYIIFTNGDLDPWRTLSVFSDLNSDSPAILINDASHCGFLIHNGAAQTHELVIARYQVSLMICGWLYTYQQLTEDCVCKILYENL